MSMKVTYYKQNESTNSSVVGYFGLHLEKMDMYLSKMKYIRNKNGGFFVAFPSEKYTNKDGEEKYSPYFCFAKATNERFQSSAKKALEEYFNEHQKAQEAPEQHYSEEPTSDYGALPF